MTAADPYRRPYRWAVLAVYAVVVALSQLLWLNFAPLLTQIQDRYQVGEMTASGLVLVFPLLYGVFSIPAGKLIDSRGYRLVVGAGSVLMAAASCIRIFDSTFAALMAGQIGIAIAQPFIVNGISKLVSDWFSPEQGAIATGLGTMGMFIGMAVGMAATPPLVESSLHLSGAMVVFSAISIAGALAFIVVARPNTQAPAAAQGGPEPGVLSALKAPGLWRMLVLAFLGMGEFNGLTTYLEQIVAPAGIKSVDAGLIGGVLIAGGIGGAVVIPALSDKFGRRKPFLLLCVFAALASVYPLCSTPTVARGMVFGAIHGFFFLPAFALLLEMTSQMSGPKLAGAATSLVMLAGNVGGVAVIVAMPLIKGNSATFASAVFLLVALLIIGAGIALSSPETSLKSARPAELRSNPSP